MKTSELKADIDNILGAAYKYDDKPHQLFSALMNLVEKHMEDKDMRSETLRILNHAYHHRGTPPRVK